jgi:DNA invertase Pin-like site-specific DNA recombinase
MSPAHRGKFVAYYRVSTDRQGKSGVGLEAQQAALRQYLNGGSWQLVAEHVEIETGKRDDRPELVKALEACRKHRARLVIAKLDRLSRNLAFIATLMDSGVEFVVVDNPHANKLTVHILAAVAEHEREMISERTKAALQAARARGTRLGNPRLPGKPPHSGRPPTGFCGPPSGQRAPIIQDIQRTGIESHNAIAAELNRRGVPTARGGKWAHVQIGNLLARARWAN